MLFGYLPFDNSNKNIYKDNVVFKEAEIPVNDFPDSCIDLMNRMLDKNFKTRIKIEDILKHEFIKFGSSTLIIKDYYCNISSSSCLIKS